MPKPPPTNDSPVPFFVLTFLLSIPFYVLNALAYLNIIGSPKKGALYIALLTVMPITSASILTFHRRGSHGLKKLLGRVFDYKRITKLRWYLAILFFMPLIFLLSIGGLALLGEQIPPAMSPLMALPAVFPFFFLLAAGEEVGWMGYAFEPMQERRGALKAALMLGMLWAIWHVPFFVFIVPDPVVLTGQVLTLVGTRVLVVWTFNNTGKSVFAAILFHAADNTALVTMPDIKAIAPWGTVVLCGLVLLAAVVVTFVWGPRTLARYRFEN